MKIETSGRRVVTDYTPWGLWLFACVFVASGLFVLAQMALGKGPSLSEPWALLGMLLLGLGHLGGGVWFYCTTPAVRCVLDYEAGLMTCTRTHLFGTTVLECPLSEVQGVEVPAEPDGEGGENYSLRLRTLGGPVILRSGGSPTKTGIHAERARLEAAMHHVMATCA